MRADHCHLMQGSPWGRTLGTFLAGGMPSGQRPLDQKGLELDAILTVLRLGPGLVSSRSADLGLRTVGGWMNRWLVWVLMVVPLTMGKHPASVLQLPVQ